MSGFKFPMQNLRGEKIASGLVGSRQSGSFATAHQAQPPIQLNRFCRNGQPPDAIFTNALHRSVNQSVLFRGAEHFSILGRAQPTLPASAAGTTAYWRFVFKTGPYSTQIGAVAVMLPPSAGYDQNGQAKLTVFSDAAETTTVASTTFTYGASPTGASTASGFPYWKVLHRVVTGLTAGTTYYARFDALNYGRLQSATVIDLPSMSESFDGYMAENLTQTTPIVDAYREQASELSNALWTNGGGKVIQWTGLSTIASATDTNIMDATTAPSSASYGYTVPIATRMLRHSKQATGLQCQMYAFGSKTGTIHDGAVKLKNSSGTTVASCGNFTGTAGWSSSGTFYLPAGTDKYDLMFSRAGTGTLSLYGVTVLVEG